MENSKLVLLLRDMSAEDVEAFYKYLASPVFPIKSREAIGTLLEVVVEEYVLGEGKATKKSVFERVFGEGSFKATSFKTQMSYLLRYLRDFLAFQQFQEDKVAQGRYLIYKLNAMGEQRLFPRYLDMAFRALAKEELSSADLFQEQAILLEEKYIHGRRGTRRNPENALEGALRNYRDAFVVRMIRYYNALLNRKHVFQQDKEPAWMGFLVRYIRESWDEMPPMVHLYYWLMEALTHPDAHGYFQNTWDILRTEQPRMSRIETHEIYISLLNLATRRLNGGQQNYLPIIFEMYQEILAQGFLLDRGKLPPWHLKNIITVAARLGEFEWADAFLDDWKNKLHGDYEDNALNYNQGLLYYFQADYEAAEQSFNRLLQDYKDMFYGINARGYLLQIFYETGNTRGMEALCHSFRMFLVRNKSIAEVKRRQHILFINHLRRFTGIPLQDKEKLRALKDEILEKEDRGMGSQWMLDKIDELLGLQPDKG